MADGIRGEEVIAANTLEFAAERGDLVTLNSRHHAVCKANRSRFMNSGSALRQRKILEREENLGSGSWDMIRASWSSW